jgi:hypothetical protein
MKFIRNTTFLLFLGLTTFSQSVSLNVGGTVSGEDKIAMRDAQVSVTKNGKPFTSFLTSFNGTYYLYLPMGAEYIVNVTKAGYAKKYFTVSTLGVSDESAKKKFSVMIADLELIESVPGVDYSVFNQPMNKYFYNPKIDNFEYDKKYLKDMIALVDEVKEAKKEAIQLAKQKAEQDKKNADLAIEKAMMDERLAIEKTNLKNLELEIAATKKIKEENTIINPATLTAPKILVTDALIVYTKTKEHLLALLAKYKIGVTEEIITGINVIIIQRILVRDQMAWVYQKKMFNWGGVSCFRDGQPITESTFENETRTT